MSLINTEIKPFKATAFKAGKFIDVTEASVKGKWSVFFFYPADFTFVCPTELEDLADHQAEFDKLGVEIYGVSTDTHFSHKAWHGHVEGDRQDQVCADRRPDRPPLAQLRRLHRGGGARRPRHVRRRPERGDPDRRDHRRRRRPQRGRADPQDQGGAVRRRPPGRGVPGQVGGGPQDPRPLARPRRRDLSWRARVSRACRDRERPARTPSEPRRDALRAREINASHDGDSASLRETRAQRGPIHARRPDQGPALGLFRAHPASDRTRRLARRQRGVARDAASSCRRSPRSPTASLSSPTATIRAGPRSPSARRARTPSSRSPACRWATNSTRWFSPSCRPAAIRPRSRPRRSSRSRGSRANTGSRPISPSPARIAPRSCRR